MIRKVIYMKLKKWLAVSALTVSCFMGGMAAQADVLTLADGKALDLGQAVSVYDGERSFFGSQIHDWLVEGKPEQSIEKVLVEEKVFPTDSTAAKDFSAVAAGILKQAKVYQVRAAANDTFYQGMVVSLTVSDSDMAKLKSYQKAAEENKESAAEEENPLVASLLAACHGKVEVGGHSDWTEKTSKAGVPYRVADAKLVLNKDGFLLPIYVKGMIMQADGKTTYTLFTADQVSGQYLADFFDTALQGVK